MPASRDSLLALRRRFSGLPDSAPKQIGLRRIHDALRYVGREDMREHVEALASQAAYELPRAEARR